MIRLDYKDARSLHQQIEDGIKDLIIGKVMKAHEQIPSVRELSISLTVNPNTVQKAYKELEAKGFIYSVKGKGNFVSPVEDARDENKIGELYEALKSAVKELLYLGESMEKIELIIKEEKP